MICLINVAVRHHCFRTRIMEEPVAYLEIRKGRGTASWYISGVHCQKCSNFSIIFHIKYEYNNLSTFKEAQAQGRPLNTPLEEQQLFYYRVFSRQRPTCT